MQARKGCEPSEVIVEPRPETIFEVPLTKLDEDNIPTAKSVEKPDHIDMPAEVKSSPVKLDESPLKVED